jgi:hypothetical protein
VFGEFGDELRADIDYLFGAVLPEHEVLEIVVEQVDVEQRKGKPGPAEPGGCEDYNGRYPLVDSHFLFDELEVAEMDIDDVKIFDFEGRVSGGRGEDSGEGGVGAEVFRLQLGIHVAVLELKLEVSEQLGVREEVVVLVGWELGVKLLLVGLRSLLGLLGRRNLSGRRRYLLDLVWLLHEILNQQKCKMGSAANQSHNEFEPTSFLSIDKER